VEFDALWAQIAGIGRDPSTGGYHRYAWTDADLHMREWFAHTAAATGLELSVDRCGNQWAWWGDPDAEPGVVTGSHLDSVPDGGAFDGPLGVVSGFVALATLRAEGFRPSRPIAVVNFCDEEGARFGVACAGSRLVTGALAPERALALRDADGITMAEALVSAGLPADLGADPDVLGRVASFVELHVEQGRGLVDLHEPIAAASAIWPHGRFRADLVGTANHAGTTQLDERDDPMLPYARLVLAARESALSHGALATCGKVLVRPNGVNAIASHVSGWVDVRAPEAEAVRAVVAELAAVVAEASGELVEESWTDRTAFDAALRSRLRAALGDIPVLATGAGHDAGILARAGTPTAMIFVRNPTGVSHAPDEYAERDDCLAGVAALTSVLRALAGGDPA
jgi:N-carbamoyl-L-amino-acid hydrolase